MEAQRGHRPGRHAGRDRAQPGRAQRGPGLDAGQRARPRGRTRPDRAAQLRTVRAAQLPQHQDRRPEAAVGAAREGPGGPAGDLCHRPAQRCAGHLGGRTAQGRPCDVPAHRVHRPQHRHPQGPRPGPGDRLDRGRARRQRARSPDRRPAVAPAAEGRGGGEPGRQGRDGRTGAGRDRRGRTGRDRRSRACRGRDDGRAAAAT